MCSYVWLLSPQASLVAQLVKNPPTMHHKGPSCVTLSEKVSESVSYSLISDSWQPHEL